MSNDGCSSLTDYTCHCAKYLEVWSHALPCVETACSVGQMNDVKEGLRGVCDEAGVHISFSEPSWTSARLSATRTAGATRLPPMESDEEEETGEKMNVGAIAGGVVGGLAVLYSAGVAVFYVRRRYPYPAKLPAVKKMRDEQD